jgi:hypothetical protein
MKRMSPRPRSPKQANWNKKLSVWRKNHRRADGSLPSLKAAMKACKGRRVSTKKCRRRSSFRKHRKAPGQYSPKRMSPLRKASAQMKAKLSPKKQQKPAQKKQQSPAQKKQKPAVFGQKAPANPMFVRGTAKKQQSPAAQKKQQKQQKPAQKKQQSPAAQKKQQKPAQRKPQFGQKAQAKPAPAMRFA